MVLKFYNTLTKKKEEFKPIKKGQVGMYVCGPTVYGPIHIGNARTFMTFDILYKYLKYKGFKVKYVQNITDVGHLTDVGEDKIMKGAKELDMNAFEFVDKMILNYFEDLDLLGIAKPDVTPRATEHIKDMIFVVQKLIENKYAYESDGYVYFNISKFKKYGKLSGQKPKELEKQRVEPHSKKKNSGDFALWIPAPEEYPMKWDSPWGKGFPGWHIECSTMGSKYLGLPFDIHGGGKDLIFPHHEDEIAQAEGATGKKFVNYWLHGEFILIDGEKMSKSLGNIIGARTAVKKYGQKVVRYFLISSHYRKEINLTEKVMEASKKTVNRLLEFMDKLDETKGGEYNKNVKELIKEIKTNFDKALDDDLNMPVALSKIHDFTSKINKYIAEDNFNEKNAEEVKTTMCYFDQVLGVLKREREEVSKEVKKLVEKREKARKKKDFEKSDELREEIKKLGWEVQDSSEGPRLRKRI